MSNPLSYCCLERKFFYISQKTLYLRLYVRKLKKILRNTFIYESILIKIYMNRYQYYEYANISFKEIWPQRSMKVTKVHPILALTETFP